MRSLIPEAVNGQLDEIVSIACHEAAVALRRSFQVLIVAERRLTPSSIELVASTPFFRRMAAIVGLRSASR